MSNNQPPKTWKQRLAEELLKQQARQTSEYQLAPEGNNPITQLPQEVQADTHSTGVWLPPGVTLEMFESDWEAYEKANNPAKKEAAPAFEIKAGLKFKNVHMPEHSFEVINVSPGNNLLSVRITQPPVGVPWTETDWNLEHTQWAFEKGEYFIEK